MREAVIFFKKSVLVALPDGLEGDAAAIVAGRHLLSFSYSTVMRAGAVNVVSSATKYN